MEVIKSSPVQECQVMEVDKGDGAVKLTKSQKPRRAMAKRKAKRMAAEHKDSLNANLESSDKYEDTDSGLAKTATVDKKMLVSSSDATTGDEKSSISGMEIDKGNGAAKLTESRKRKLKASSESLEKREDTENTKSKPEVRFYTISLSSLQENPSSGDQKSSSSKIEEHTKASNGEMGASMTTNLIAEVKTQNKMEAAINAIVNTASKKRKRQKEKNTNPESGDVLGTRESSQDKTATPDANMVLKGEDHTKVAYGNMGSSANTSINVDGTLNPNKKPKSKNKSPTLGEILNPGHVQAANGEKGSRRKSKDTHELRKREWLESQKEKLALGGNLSTSESTVIAKKDSSTAKVVEAMNDAGKKKRKPKSKNTRRPTLGEILNPRYLELLEAGIEIKKSEKRMWQKLNKENLASSSILRTGESTQDTNKPLEALSTELKREDHPKTANGEKGPSTIVDAESTLLKGIACTEVANIAEPAELEIAEAKANTTLPIKMVKQNTEVQEKTQVSPLGKKLVIFDLNGLLADIVSPPPKDIIADYRIPRRAIFKRPFLDDFLCFCFERFHVGIWSSRTMKNLNPVVDFLLGDLKKKLFFLWDASKCTNSGMRTLEDRRKHLVFKDLKKKIWENGGPNNSWVKGSFNESNTLLLDDSPCKALVNPKHSGIFPVSYSYKNRDDNFLGPKGELQNYLEGLAASDNVKTYVEQHPFGQSAIDERHPKWTYYARVLKGQTR